LLKLRIPILLTMTEYPQFPGSIDEEEISIELMGDSIRWRHVGLPVENSKSLNLSAVICVIPAPKTHKFEYQLLYLRPTSDRAGESNDDTYCFGVLYVSNLPRTFLTEYFCPGLPPHLKIGPSDHGPNIHIIISVLSGIKGARKFFQTVLRPFLAFFEINHYEVHETSSERSILELARFTLYPRAKQSIPQTVLLLSGDGGLVDLIRGFSIELGGGGDDDDAVSLLERPCVALIPQGTGNALANSTGILSREVFGLDSLVRGTPHPLPTFTATFSPGALFSVNEGQGREEMPKSSSEKHYPQVSGAVVLSWGLHAALVADSDTAEYRKFGPDRFKMAAQELLYPHDGSPTHRYHGTITVTTKIEGKEGEDEQRFQSSEHMYVLVTMVSQLEKGFTISPASTPLDGQLRLLYFGPMAPQEAMNLMTLAYQNGRHVQNEVIRYEAIESIRVHLKEVDERWRRLCLDGQVIVVEEDGWVEVHRNTQSVLKIITHRP
jgi:diacylglycerol kinase family enzyme